MVDLGLMQPMISSSTTDVSALGDGRSGGIPPAERNRQNNSGGIIPNIDYFSFVPYIYTIRLVKRQYIDVLQEQNPSDPSYSTSRGYLLLNNWCLSPYLRTISSWNNNTPNLTTKANALICREFPFMRIGKLRLRLSNFLPVINSVNTSNSTTISTINPAPWMCIAMDTRGDHRKIAVNAFPANTPLGNDVNGWNRIFSNNCIPISNINNCSQWSHVETLQMGQVWTYEQEYPNDPERWYINPIKQDIGFIANKNMFLLPSNTLPPSVGTSWWNPTYPANDARTYHPATPLPPIAIYVPFIGGLSNADNDPQISGSITLESSLELHFCSYVEPHEVLAALDSTDEQQLALAYLDFKSDNGKFIYFNTFIHK